MLEKKKAFIVAVDGPAGSGKSSVCSSCAKDLGWIHVNTGMFYRAAALLTIRNKFDYNTQKELILKKVQYLASQFQWDYEKGLLLLDDEVLNNKLNTPEIGQLASKLASIPEVRSKLHTAQRNLGLKAPAGAILDGRDIASVIFPDADLKVFLTASLKSRAKRRFLQLKKDLHQKNPLVNSLDEIEKSLNSRDHHDSQRKVAPLRKDPEAKVLDTSFLSFEESINALKKMIMTYKNKKTEQLKT